MAQIATLDGELSRISNGYTRSEPFYAEFQTARQAISFSAGRMGWVAPIPNPLPTGVTAYRLLKAINYSPSIYPLLVCKMVLMGTLTASGSSPGTFTDGAAMPTVTTLGNTGFASYAGLWAEITTAISGTVTSFTTTWNDVGGNSRTVSPSLTTGAVVGSGGFLTGSTFGAQSSQATDVTAMSFTGASPTGVIKVYGIIPLAVSQGRYTTTSGMVNNQTMQFHDVPLAAGDLIGVIAAGFTTATAAMGSLIYLGDS